MTEHDAGRDPDEVDPSAARLAAALSETVAQNDISILWTHLNEELGNCPPARLELLVGLLNFLWEWDPRPLSPGRLVEATARGWAEIVLTHCDAAASMLRSPGREAVAATCARVAFEHAVYLSLLAATEDPDSVLEAREARGIRDVGLVISGTGGGSRLGSLGEIFASLGQAHPSNPEMDWAHKMEQVSGRLVTGPVVYAEYRLLSQGMHPSVLPALSFLIDPDAEPSALIPPEMVAKDAIAACLWAGWSLEKLLAATGFSGFAQPIADEVEIIRLEAASGGGG